MYFSQLLVIVASRKINEKVIRKHNLIFFLVIQNNFTGNYKNKIISNISIGILILISIFNGFSANHIQLPKTPAPYLLIALYLTLSKEAE